MQGLEQRLVLSRMQAGKFKGLKDENGHEHGSHGSPQTILSQDCQDGAIPSRMPFKFLKAFWAYLASDLILFDIFWAPGLDFYICTSLSLSLYIYIYIQPQPAISPLLACLVPAPVMLYARLTCKESTTKNEQNWPELEPLWS